MPNKRISDLEEVRTVLYSDSAATPFPSKPSLNAPQHDDKNIHFLLARPLVQNETITYPELKTTVLENSLYLTGNQLISGETVFTDVCTFLSRVNTNEMIDHSQTGDISGDIFVSDSGLFQTFKMGTDFFNRELDHEEYTFHATGDSCFLGDIILTGEIYQSGDFVRIGDTQHIGEASISGWKKITNNIYTQQNIFHKDDQDTLIQLKLDRINLEAGKNTSINLIDDEDDRLIFNTVNEEQMRFDKNSSLAINNTDPIGEISVTGNCFIEDVYVYDEISKRFNRVFGGDDENVSFKTKLRKGSDTYKINLPKTFKEKPVISLMLEHESGGVIPPIIMTEITAHDFVIKLGKALEDNSYILHTTALSTSIKPGIPKENYNKYPHVVSTDNAAGRLHEQRFYTPILEKTDEVEIQFPFDFFEETPSVSVTIEGPNNIVPHAISSVNNRSYKIIFGTQVDTRYTIHTFSSTPGRKRLGYYE